MIAGPGGLVGTYDEPATGDTWQAEPVSGLALGAGESQVEQIWSADDGSFLARTSFWEVGDPRAGSTLLECPSASGPWSVPEFIPPLVGDRAVLTHVILGISTLVEHPAGGLRSACQIVRVVRWGRPRRRSGRAPRRSAGSCGAGRR